MNGTVRRIAVTGICALALGLAPMVFAPVHLPGLDDTAWARNAGNKGGNSGGGGSHRSNSSLASSHSSHAGGNGNGNANGHAKGDASASDESEVELAEFVPPGQDREKNIHALLGGLNSLQRAYEGLMNSSDPRMGPFRDYVMATGQMELAEVALDEAIANLGLPPTWDGADPYAEGMTLDALMARYSDLLLVDPASFGDDEEGLAMAAAFDAEMTALETFLNGPQVLGYLDSLEGTGDDALIAAIDAGANPNANYEGEDLQRVMDWINDTLGVGEDAVGAVDEYMATLVADPAAAPEPAPPPADFEPEPAL